MLYRVVGEGRYVVSYSILLPRWARGCWRALISETGRGVAIFGCRFPRMGLNQQ